MCKLRAALIPLFSFKLKINQTNRRGLRQRSTEDKEDARNVHIRPHVHRLACSRELFQDRSIYALIHQGISTEIRPNVKALKLNTGLRYITFDGHTATGFLKLTHLLFQIIIYTTWVNVTKCHFSWLLSDGLQRSAARHLPPAANSTDKTKKFAGIWICFNCSSFSKIFIVNFHFQ